MADHRTIIEGLGGIRKLARSLGHSSHTTVQGWYERNSIPLDRWSEIIDETREADRPITSVDLLPADIRPTEQAAA